MDKLPELKNNELILCSNMGKIAHSKINKANKLPLIMMEGLIDKKSAHNINKIYRTHCVWRQECVRRILCKPQYNISVKRKKEVASSNCF